MESREAEGSIASTISWKEREIQVLSSHSSRAKGEEIRKAERELENLLEEEEKYWRIRSREDWLKWGDQNTKWFHSKANFRKKKRNKMEGITNKEGVWVRESKKVGETVASYFKELFSTSNPNQEAINEILSCL